MRRIAAVATAAFVVVLLLALAQLVLPGIAASRLRDRLSKSGKVLDVEVSAFPAIELLWHQADRVVVRMQNYRASPGRLGSTLSQAGDAGSLDATAGELDSGLLTLRGATLQKRGNQLSGSATVSEADIRAALPILDSVQPVASSGGQLTLNGVATVFGLTASVNATVMARSGRLVIQPDVPFGGLATITVFSNPHVSVESVGASPTAGGFSISAQGQLQ